MMSKLSVFVCTGVAVMVVASASAPAMSAEKTLYRFKGGSDGAQPYGNLIEDTAGNLYGTTSTGGGGTGCEFGNGCGTVFMLSVDGREHALHAFAGGCDGAFPMSGLITDNGTNYYGTTTYGGACNDEGFGTVFQVAPNGAETVVYEFKGGTDGQYPSGALFADKKGDFYGETGSGGNTSDCGGNGCGTVFELKPSGNKALLYAFSGTDGAYPIGGMIADKAGDLYGTTYEGGSGTSCENGCGTVFKITSTGAESVIYSFQGGNDGLLPEGGVIADSAGNLYGTTSSGGTGDVGTVFKITPDGTETVLYSFQPITDGYAPMAGVVMDKSGNLYGTTAYGGIGCKKDGCGTVYELVPDGKETVLYAFKPSSGRKPAAALLMGKHDTLYGTTTAGGGSHKRGTVFSLTTK